MKITRKEELDKDGKLKVFYEYVIDIQTKPRKQERRRFEKEKDCKRAMLARIEEIRNNKVVVFSDITFAQGAKKFIDNAEIMQYSEITISKYRSHTNNHLQYFWDKKMIDIKKADVKGWVTSQVKCGLSPFLINDCVKFCKAVYNYFIDLEKLIYNPFSKIGKIEEPKKDINILSVKEAVKVLNTCKNIYPDFYPILHLAFFTGLRQSEILGLTWENIDLKNNKAKIRQQFCRGKLKKKLKTSSSYRDVDLTPEAVNVLKEHKIKSSKITGYVFVNQEGKPINACNLMERRYRPLLEACGYDRKYIKFHDLRHTYVSYLLANGIPINYVQAQVGHSKHDTTMDVYGHLTPDINKRAVKILDKVFRDKNVTKTKKQRNKKEG